MTDQYLRKTLIELLGDSLDPDYMDDTQATVLSKLGNKPLRRFAIADIYGAIRTNLGLPYTVPMALEALEEEPFLEASEYPGDLLIALMEADSRFWQDHEDLWLKAISILEQAVQLMNERMQEEERGEYLPWHIGDDFMGALLHFRDLHR